MVIGLMVMLVGAYDLTQLNVETACQLLHYNSLSLFIASKVTHVCLALDQFIAVTRPLHCYQTMQRACPWLIAAIWLAWAANFLAGILAVKFDLPTYAEVTVGEGNASLVYDGCRWEKACADANAFAIEVQLLILSLITAGLLIYIGVVGHRTAVQLMQARRNRTAGPEDQRFFSNYRAFKKILIVCSLTVTLDIIGPTVRIISRWYPMPKPAGFVLMARLLAIILEGWTYGLSNVQLRAAYRRTLCGPSNRVSQEAVECLQCGRLQIFRIACGKSCKNTDETAQEIPISTVHPKLRKNGKEEAALEACSEHPQIAGVRSDAPVEEDGPVEAGADAAHAAQLEIESSMTGGASHGRTDEREERGNQQRGEEDSDESTEDDNQKIVTGQAEKKQQVVLSIVADVHGEDSLED